MNTFTAHNVRLDDGTLTKPDLSWEMTEHPLLQSIARLFGSLYPEGISGKRIVDLGCLEGGYTVEFARMGLASTGIEVRQSNFDNCNIVKAGCNLPDLKFIKDDAWNVDKYGTFDIVFCCGLLYHLSEPNKFMKLLSKSCREVLILDTHFSTEIASKDHSLSEIEVHEGMRGRWFVEYPETMAPKSENHKLASWGNHRSFWPLRSELTAAIQASGFDSVLELIDSKTTQFHKQRQTFIGLKSRARIIGS